MQPSRWTWLTLAACVATGARAEEEATPRVWAIPPVQVSGLVSYDLRASRGGDSPSILSHLVTATLAGRTYLWQPWFATLGGNVGVTTTWTRTGADPLLLDSPASVDASLHEQIHARERFLTGSARLDLFPQSRFPFEAHVERTDSRIASGLATTFDFQTSDIGFSQRYRPPGSAWSVGVGYDHRVQSGTGFRSRQDSFTGDFATHWKANELGLTLSNSRARSDGLDDESRFASVVMRHDYRPSSELSINSTANWTRTEDKAPVAPSDLTELQWSSVGVWRREGSPLSVTASGRALSLREDVTDTTLSTGGLTLGANYEFNPNLRLTATGGAVFTRSNGTDATTFTGALGAAWQGDSLRVLGARYDYFASGAASTSVAEGDVLRREQQTNLNLQVGHSLTRNWATGEQAMLIVSGIQSLAWNDARSSSAVDGDPGIGTVRTLLDSVSLAWQAGSGERNAYARALASDSRELGGDNRFRLFNFQLSGNFAIDNRRSLSGDLTWQRTWQQVEANALAGAPAGAAVTGSTSASGEINYRHVRPFGIPGLRFVSRLKLAQDVLKQPGTLLSLPDRETRLWENRLDYTIGRLDTQLVLRIAEVDGRRRESLMFRVQRSFGN